ncbi:hypothetical protein E2320_001036, partial [Naja naja]
MAASLQGENAPFAIEGHCVMQLKRMGEATQSHSLQEVNFEKCHQVSMLCSIKKKYISQSIFLKKNLGFCPSRLNLKIRLSKNGPNLRQVQFNSSLIPGEIHSAKLTEKPAVSYFYGNSCLKTATAYFYGNLLLKPAIFLLYVNS